MPAPIALFVYNRLWHTQQTVTALKNNDLAAQSELYVFSDGAKSDADIEKVNEIRRYIRTITGFKAVYIKESLNNKGLADSIITGVSDVLSNIDKIVVLEDDMITSRYFLTYMNTALDTYENDHEVISIHGYVYPVSATLPETFFLKGADCWGWATWRRGWNLFEPDGRKLLKELNEKDIEYEFNFYGAYPFKKMLEKQISGANNSWAIRWYAAAFLKGKLTLYPGRSLVQNIGNDTSGTHSWDQQRYDHRGLTDSLDVQKIRIEENKSAKEIIGTYLRTSNPSIFRKIFFRIKFLLQRKWHY